MLDITETLRLKETLESLLKQLYNGVIDAIEYGDPDFAPGSFFSYIRVKRIKTPAGVQYAVKLLFSGVEGSGDYHQTAESTVTAAMNAIIHYHRPTRLSKFITKPVKQLSWMPLVISGPNEFALAKEEKMLDQHNKMFPDSQEIELHLE